MKNKKTIMTFSAILILIFHLWISITNTQTELFLRQLCVIGVDLFFFISAYSIGSNKKISYKKFITNRFNTIYLKYILFALVGFFYLSWKPSRLLKIILGLELFTKGGGAFLWFIPGIMLVYLILPVYKYFDNKYPKVTPIVVITLFFIVSISLSVFTNYDKLFILTNRIPIILAGYYFAKYNILNHLDENIKLQRIIMYSTTISGFLIAYILFINHFYIDWFKDIFYVMYMPLTIGVVLLLNKIESNRLFDIIGGSTLELYAIQMIFGFTFANKILTLTKMKLLSNIITITILILSAIVVNYLFNKINKILRNS